MHDKFYLRIYIFLIFVVLSLVGILIVYSSTSITAWKVYGKSEYFLLRQSLFFLAGIVVFFLVLAMRVGFLKKIAFPFFVFNIFLLLLVLFVGKEAGGAKRWFSLMGFNLQVSEVAKIALVLYLADYLERKQYNLQTLKGVIAPLSLAGACAFFILLEPDFGGAVFFLFIGLVIVFLGGAQRKHIGSLVAAGTGVLSILIFSSPYRIKRVLAFLDPWKDPQGIGFQITQAQIAFGTGGWLGKGLGKGLQKHFYLPAAHTDFIMAIVGEETGFAGVFLVVVLFLILFFLSLRLLKDVSYVFNYFLGLGALLVIIFQVLINFGVVSGLLPTKGLPLPFLSYGGSSYLSSCVLLALVLNASRDSQ